MTGFLVRSISKNWVKGSVLAVDAGSHLAAITRLLEPNFPLVSSKRCISSLRSSGSLQLLNHDSSETAESEDSDLSEEVSSVVEPHITTLATGPFTGLPFPHESARANALHVVREYVATYLITHPHLDHLSGFVINTAAFHNTSRPKRLAALPSTIQAIKTHIFNDVIWPNLTDEDGGVGFVTFQRLASGGNIAVGEGQGKGYIEVCDGLCVKGMKVSHGHCTRSSDATLHRGSEVGLSEATVGKSSNTNNVNYDNTETNGRGRVTRTPSISQFPQPGSPAIANNITATASGTTPAYPTDPTQREVVVDSTAYFIRDDHSGREILFFGDVEPDALSLCPRNAQVWTEAAPKIAAGLLKMVVLECSYDDGQGDNVLFGHLAPRWVVRELEVLAGLVTMKKAEERERRNSEKERRSSERERRGSRKRRRTEDDEAPVPSADGEVGISKPDGNSHQDADTARRRSMMKMARSEPLVSTTQVTVQSSPPSTTPAVPLSATTDVDGSKRRQSTTALALPEAPLAGLTVLIMHIKDTLRDGPLVGEVILRQLREHEGRLRELDGVGLGCEFVISRVGGSYWV